jgi:hypothetical protein
MAVEASKPVDLHLITLSITQETVYGVEKPVSRMVTIPNTMIPANPLQQSSSFYGMSSRFGFFRCIFECKDDFMDLEGREALRFPLHNSRISSTFLKKISSTRSHLVFPSNYL